MASAVVKSPASSKGFIGVRITEFNACRSGHDSIVPYTVRKPLQQR